MRVSQRFALVTSMMPTSLAQMVHSLTFKMATHGLSRGSQAVQKSVVLPSRRMMVRLQHRLYSMLK